MASKLITAPATTPVTVQEAKDHLRVDGTTEDPLIEGLITSATDYAEAFTRRALMTQTWKAVLDEFPEGPIGLDVLPLQSVTSIKYTDTDGAEQTLAATEYDVDTVSGRIAPAYGETWPDTRKKLNAVTVRYDAGYATVPGPIKAAILLAIGTLYENREGQGDALRENKNISLLLWPYRNL